MTAGCGSGSGAGGSSAPLVGRPAPAWSGRTVSGAPLSLGALRGRWVVLNFFATWCGPCQRETPQLEAFAAGGRARIVGVVYEDSPASARRFATSHGVTWPLVDDAAGAIGQRYQVGGLPVSFVIDPGGKLVRQVFGGVTVGGLDQIIPPVRTANTVSPGEPKPGHTDGAPKGAISGAARAADLETALPGVGGGFPLQTSPTYPLTAPCCIRAAQRRL